MNPGHVTLRAGQRIFFVEPVSVGNLAGLVVEIDPLLSSEESFTLTVDKSGTGSGTVTGTGINCGTDCTHTFSGDLVTLSPSPDAGSNFVSWSGCTFLVGGTGQCQVLMTADRAVTATFDSSQQTLTFLPFSDNLLIVSSLDSSSENTVFATAENAAGCNWLYSSLTSSRRLSR